MLLIVTVLPLPAAPLIGTGYMECVQLSGESFVRKELHINWKSRHKFEFVYIHLMHTITFLLVLAPIYT